MKAFLVLCSVIAIALAAPPKYKTENNESPVASIVQYENNNFGSGAYNFSYQTSDGMQREEQGVHLDPKNPDSPIIVSGSYTYKVPDGTQYTVYYVADENGYRVVDKPKESHRRA